MLKILVASSKGGCGKSTIATSLAAHYAQGGKNTAIVDADDLSASGCGLALNRRKSGISRRTHEQTCTVNAVFIQIAWRVKNRFFRPATGAGDHACVQNKWAIAGDADK